MNAFFGSISNGGGFIGFSFGNGGGCVTGICFVANTIIFIINGVLVPVLFSIAFIVFLYGVAQAYIFNGGNEDARKRGHQIILWGLIGFAVMISIWGLVNVVANTFGLAGFAAPPLPSSTSGLPVY